MAKQVGALCWRKRQGRREVLLITSRETRRWVIPKGWPMGHIADFNAAKIEAYEEAGVLGQVRRQPLGRYRYDKIEYKGARPMTVIVYSLKIYEVLSAWPEQRERKRQWMSPTAAAEAVDEPGLKQIILALSAL